MKLKEMVVAYFKVLFVGSGDETEQDHEKY